MSEAARKEKVIHTRIPAALEEEIKRVAEGLRVPVSSLVRNVLEDAIGVTRGVAESSAGQRELAHIFAWQALTLNIQTTCARCGKHLAMGDTAFLGLSDHPRDVRVFICSACLPRQSRDRNPKQGVSHVREG